MEKRYLLSSIFLLLSAGACLAAQNVVAPYYSIRSQSFNSARKVAGQVGHVNLPDMQENYKNFYMAVEYDRSWKPSHIAQCLFGDKINECGTLKIQGSRVGSRDANALLADYFYLPTDFDSEVTFKPRISNFLFDFQLYVGLGRCLENSYFRVYAPVVRTSWDLNVCEDVNDSGNNDHVNGYFTPSTMSRDDLNRNFLDYATGSIAPRPLTDIILSTSENITIDFQNLRFAKICKQAIMRTKLADMRMEFGWNFINNDDYHLGANLQVAMPTGNRPEAFILFDPVVGNGKHWEFGGGVTAHYMLWRNDDETQQLGLHLDATIMHMFKTRQNRTFDLVGKPLSRYMLAMRMDGPLVGLLAGDQVIGNDGANSIFGPPADVQFKNEYAPVANLTSVDVEVSVKLQADIALWLNYQRDNFSLDLGYGFWGRACETIECPDDCPSRECAPCPNLCDPGQENVWALKGDAHVFGYDIPLVNNVPVDCDGGLNAIPLSATQKAANICGGLNYIEGRSIADAMRNPGVDNPELAHGAADEVAAVDQVNADITGPTRNLYSQPLVCNVTPTDTTRTSIQSAFINCDDIDFCATTRGISHKLWGHLQYNWDKDDCWQPYLGIGGEIEFAKHADSIKGCDDKPCLTDCSRCIDCALSQWGLWLKAGVDFD